MNRTSEPTEVESLTATTPSMGSRGNITRHRALMVARWISILLIVGSLLAIVRSLPMDRGITATNGWISGLGIWGPVVLALVYIAATVLFVPGTILTLTAGALFGLGVGTISVSIGSTLGASIAFLITRHFARDRIAAMASRNPRFGAIDRAIGEEGWKIVALLRLSPAIPFNLQNYLYGLTPVRFWPYVLTSWLAMLPGTFLYVYLGHATKSAVGADRSRTPAEWSLLAVGLVATIVVTVQITRVARRKLQSQMDEARLDGETPPPDETASTIHNTDDIAPRLTSTVVLGAAALLMVGGAAYATTNQGEIQRWITGWFGPPPVELSEAYSESSSGPTFNHSTLDALLREHVDADGWIDYDGLKRDEGKLDEYLAAVEAAAFDTMGRDEKLALLINAYNAFTLKLIIERQPIDSIMDIPNSQRWDAIRWNVGGHAWSLSQIEHEQIRPKFIEPRVHFALVCAAAGCPPLRSEAYHTARLDEQLAAQTSYVHRHATWFQFDAPSQTARLTKLYNWYGGDFEQVAGSTLKFASRHSPELKQALENGDSPRIEWLPYDWKLNSVENKQPR